MTIKVEIERKRLKTFFKITFNRKGRDIKSTVSLVTCILSGTMC